jgi:hypothetical protein
MTSEILHAFGNGVFREVVAERLLAFAAFALRLHALPSLAEIETPRRSKEIFPAKTKQSGYNTGRQ